MRGNGQKSLSPSPCEGCRRQGACAVIMCGEWKQWFAREWKSLRGELAKKARLRR